MKKVFKSYVAIWAIMYVVFFALSFLGVVFAQSGFGGAFWAGYIFITLAFIGQLVCGYITFKPQNSDKVFYGIALFRASYVGLIATAIAGGICMALPFIPDWAGIVICLIIFAFNAIAVVKASLAVEAVEQVDEKIKTQTLFVKMLTADASTLNAKAKTDEAKAACKKVYEAIRYSDPMSSDALAGVESQITLKFNEFSAAVADGAENIGTLADELVVLIADRNNKCKILK